MSVIQGILPQGLCSPTYELHGLCIRSEVALHAPVYQSDSPDLDVRWGESFAIPDEPPAGCVLAKLSFADGRGYTLSETGSGYTLRFHQTCEFRIDHNRRSIGVHLAPGVDPGIAPLLLARRGFPASLHIGVAKQGQEKQLEAHAWVESEGKVLIGGSEPGRYTSLLALEGEER